MKINNFFLFALIVLISFSCKNEKVIQTDSYTFEEKYALTQDTTKGILEITMKMEIPVKYQNQEVLKKIRDSIVKNILGERYISVNNDVLLQQYAEDMKKEYRDNNLPFMNDEIGEDIGFAFNNDYELEGFSLMSDEKVYSYGANIYVYMGGAHGLYSKVYYNYDLQTGNLIEQNDLFTEEGISKLPQLLIKHIMSSNENINSEEELADSYWIDQIRPNDNFYITTDGINYVFNAYEIAPYSLGYTEVYIPFNELRPFFKNNTIIGYLIK